MLNLNFFLIILALFTKLIKSQELSCLNGGVLVKNPASGSSEVCICNKNFIGERCEKRLDSLSDAERKAYGCALRPCWIGATCEDVPNGAVCHCAANTYGEYCEKSSLGLDDPCKSKPCYNNATCIQTDQITYKCSCYNTFDGPSCKQSLLGACASNPCLRDGICEPLGTNDYRCKCPDWTMGKNCEVIFNPCSKVTCMNNGLCLKKRTLAYECNCLEGYTGLLCDQLVGQTCPSRACQKGGCQLDAVSGKYGCVCSTQGYTGSFCEVELCEPKCQNGGVCDRDESGNYFCRCPSKYKGRSCSEASCFSMNTMVETKERGIIKVSELNNKDFVKTFDYSNDEWKFSRFVTYLHKDDEMVGEYISVKTNSGRTLSISALHLIARRIKETSKVEFVLAKELKRSDYLVTEESREEQVAELELVYEKGAYAPLTESGTIAVNSIAASCYANTNSHSFIHLVFQPLIQWSKYFSVDSANFDSLFNTRDSSAQTQSLPDSVFWYAKFLFGLLPYVPYSSSFIIF